MITDIIKQVLDSREDIKLNKDYYYYTIDCIKEILMGNKYFNEVLMENFNLKPSGFENNTKRSDPYRSSLSPRTGKHKAPDKVHNKNNGYNIEKLIGILALVNYSIDHYFQSAPRYRNNKNNPGSS